MGKMSQLPQQGAKKDLGKKTEATRKNRRPWASGKTASTRLEKMGIASAKKDSNI